MISGLNKELLLLREHPGIFKAANNFDVLDPATNEISLECREENVSKLTRFFRFFPDLKRRTPFEIRINTTRGKYVGKLTRGVLFLASQVKVYDEDDNLIGGFKQRPFTLLNSFDVLDAQENVVCKLNGDFAGMNFSLQADSKIELATVAKKWAGLGRELLTGDDYMLSIDEAVPENSTMRLLILASVICVGMVAKVEIP